MARLMDWSSIQNLDDGVNRIIALDSLQFAYLQALSSYYQSRYSWVAGANDVTDEQWKSIDFLQSQTELDLMGNMIGMIIPNVLNDISDLGLLECNGDTYLKADYPQLYDAIAPAYIIDADSFFVPDLQQRFPVGASLSVPIGTIGGEDDVTLDVSEMPNHGHSTVPHSHSIAGAGANVMSVTAGVPAPSALPLPLISGASGVTVNNTGGGGAHNNIPPYHAISYVIVSG